MQLCNTIDHCIHTPHVYCTTKYPSHLSFLLAVQFLIRRLPVLGDIPKAR